MNHTIVQAIQEKKLLSLTYDNISRVVEPHIYGKSANGKEYLRCYQIKGGHKSSTKHDWELLEVSKVTSLSETGDCFLNARPDYVRSDKRIKTIYAQL